VRRRERERGGGERVERVKESRVVSVMKGNSL
jgi:hypothetical protein